MKEVQDREKRPQPRGAGGALYSSEDLRGSAAPRRRARLHPGPAAADVVAADDGRALLLGVVVVKDGVEGPFETPPAPPVASPPPCPAFYAEEAK